MIKTASFFSLFCGITMLAVWGILLATGQFLELRSKPFEARFLLGAEFLTAASLILGGFGLECHRWVPTLETAGHCRPSRRDGR